MKPISIFAAAALASIAFISPKAAHSEPGQKFPGVTCTCKGCGPNKSDVTGKCPSVCKDKTVFSKGSEPHDYCKAASVRLPRGAVRARPDAVLTR